MAIWDYFYLVQCIVSEDQSMAIVVDVREGHHIFAVTENTELSIPRRLQ